MRVDDTNDQPELPRRSVLQMLGLLVLAACGSSASRTTATTAPTDTSGAGRGLTTTSPGSAASTTTTAAVVTTSSALPSTTSVVPGANVNITRDVLESDANGYNGRWVANWKQDSSAATGTFTVDLAIHPDSRSMSFDLTTTGDLLGGPVAPLHLDFNFDTYIYDDNGDFTIQLATSAGQATVSKGDGPGSFDLRIVDIPNHPELVSFEGRGVANRLTEIPMTFTMTRTDGDSTTGSCTFIPQH